MARRDWSQLQAEYELEFRKTGISIKQWCDKKDINYNTARRYLKVITNTDQLGEKEPNSRTFTSDASTNESAKRLDSDHLENQEKSAKPEPVRASADSAQSDQLNCAQVSDQSDQLARFMPTVQRNMLGQFLPNNTASQKHGAYARRLGDLDAIFDASRTAIDDEIEMCRARTMISMTKYREIEALLEQDDLEPMAKVKLYELWKEADIAIDRNVARIESLLKTKAAVRKSELESERLASEQAGLGTAIADIVSEIQAMESDGFVIH